MTASPTPPHLISALADLDDAPPAFSSEHDEAPARRQPGDVFDVYLEGGEVLEVRAANRDVIAWEKTKARHKEWPAAADAPIFATTFVIWNAAKRAGLTSLTFDAFADAVVDFDKVRDEPADPTR
jgi:hypothetical protein